MEKSFAFQDLHRFRWFPVLICSRPPEYTLLPVLLHGSLDLVYLMR